MNKKFISIFMLVIIMISSATVFADSAVGDVIISLGADLTESEKESILEEFNAPESVYMIVTTNAEEHEYLGDVIPAGKIGNNAISSVMITYTDKGSGLKVDTSDKITYITERNYINALITAGVEDADIKITSPKNATGTAALTGIMKAYEVSTGEVIDDDIKKVANEEMVRTAELGELIGNDKASDLINKIKQEIAEKNPKTKEEVRDIVINIVNNFNINLSDEQIEQLVALFDKMKNLDIDWDQVYNQIENIAGKASEYLSSEEGQGFLQSLKSFLNALIDWIASIFRA
ncbi:DUF1002 domain-containing protein [Tissierella sp. Yu-01]|uniref:DUF1002 domain-containing protein n=1 Tax=Tissierella sp. Yu-01 TaxID=3035694 RepID=UPI00240DC589|nr:DUF1002 domain-containing protein [Tissierella sp. Yu-01]WFA09249.1 DUF1002 domain-containing protein [Tissierella sp. Yu-01]